MAGRKRIYSEILNFENNEEPVNEDDDVKFKNPRKNLFDDFLKTNNTGAPADEHMKCYLRIRPFTKDELDREENKDCLSVEPSGNSVTTLAPKNSNTYRNCAHGLGKTTHKYTFSKIFKDDTTQKEFFNETMLGLVKDFIDGQNCLVFTYGVTSSGKTYTIQGEPKDAGILPRALDVLFNSISNKQCHSMNLKPKMFTDVVKLSADQVEYEKKIKEKTLKLSNEEDPDVMSLLGDDATDMSHIVNTTSSSESSNISCLDKTSKDSLDTDELFSALENRIREETAVNVEDQGQIKFLIWVSFAEIYNEQIFDLLEPLPKKKNARRPVLRLSDDKHGSPYIKGLKEINVTSADEAYKLLTIGQRNLQKACTKLNHCSSRSHCIFNIKILRVVDKGDPHVARVSMLSLCDLAGSERHSKTHSAGERLKEAGNINTSLMTLGRCIETLRYNQNHKDSQRIIPFRDSKLTRLFQNFFSGKGKAVMIVNVNQLASMFDETLHVFKFSAIAKQVTVVQRPDPPRPKMLSLSALKPPKDPRSSIMWDTPGAVTKMKSVLTSAQAVPLPEGDDNELEDDQSDEIEELVSIIQQLQKQLEDERKEKIMQECKIRDEVCKEMMKQLVEIELECSERIREREIMAEELADQRIKILMEAKQPQQEFMQDDDDEWVSSVLYHQEKVKVENKEKEIEELKKEITQLKSQNKESKLKEFDDIRSKISEEQEKLKAENSKLQDLLSETRKNEELRSKEKKEAEETIKDLKDKIKQLQSEDKGSGSDIGLLESMTGKLQDCKEEIKSKEEEIKELNDMLKEAGETFNQREVELQDLKAVIEGDNEKFKQQENTIKELEKALEESRKAVESADERLKKRDERLLSIDSENDSLKDGVKNLQNNAKFLEDLVKERENELNTWKRKCEREEEESFKKEQALIHGYKAEIATLKQQILSLKTSKLHAEREKNTSMMSEFDSSLAIAKATIDDLEKQLEMEKEIHAKDLSRISELETEDITIETLKKSLEEIKANYEEVESNLATKVEENLRSDGRIKELETKLLEIQSEKLPDKICGLEKSLLESKSEIDCKSSEIEKLKDKLEELETVNGSLRQIVNETTCELQNKEKQIQEVLSPVKVNEVHQTNSESPVLISSLQTLMKKLKAENVSLKESMKEKEAKVNKLKQKCDKMETERGKAKTVFTEKNDKVKELSGKCKDFEFQLDEKEIEISDLKSQMEQLGEQLSERDNDIIQKSKQISELNDEMNKVKFAKEMLESDMQNVEEMDGEKIQTLTQEKDDLLERLKESEEEVQKLTENLSAKNEGKKEAKNKNSDYKKLEKELERVSKELENKVSEIEAMKEVKCDIESLKKELNKKGEMIASYEEKLREKEEIQNELAEKSFEIVYLQSELSEKSALKKELENMYERIKELEQQVDEKEKLQKDLEEGKEKIKKIESELNDNLNIEKKLDEKDVEIQNFEKKLREHEQAVENYKNQLDGKISENKKLCEEIKETKEKLDEAMETIKTSLENRSEEIVKLKEKCAEYVEKINMKESEIEKYLESEEKHQKQLLEYSEKISHLENEVMSKEKRMTELNLSYEEMQHQLTHNNDHSSELSEAKLQIAELKSTVHMTKVLHQKAKEQVQEQTERIEVLEKDLKSVRGIREEKQKLEDLLSEKEAEVKKLQNSLQQAKHDDIQEEKQKLEELLSEKGAAVKELQNSLQKAKIDAEEKSKRIAELEKEKKEISDNLDMNKFDAILSEKESQMTVLQERLDELVKDNEKLKNDMESKVRELESSVNELENLRRRNQDQENVKDIVSEKMEEIKVLKDELKILNKRLDEIERRKSVGDNMSEVLNEKVKVIGELESKIKCLEEKLQEKGELKNKVKTLEQALEEKGELQDKINCLEEKVAEKIELEKKLKTLEEKLEEKEQLEIKIKTLKQQLEEVNVDSNKIMSEVKEKQKETGSESENGKECTCALWEKQAENLQKLYESEKKKNDEYKAMMEDMKLEDCLSPSSKNSCIRKLRKDKIEAENSLIEAKFKLQNLETVVADLKNKNSSKDICDTETSHCEKFSKMDKLIRKLTVELKEKDDNNRKLVSELAQCHSKVEDLESEITNLRKQVSRKEQEMSLMSPRKITQCEQLQRGSITSPTVHRELNRSQEREQNLRTRLDEASKNMKEMNEKITELEASLLKKNLQIEEMEAMNQLSGSQKTPKKEDNFDDSEKLREELREKWKSIQDLQEQNYRLEQKLQTKLQTIKDLRDTIETERKGFDTALADAQANEKLIQELKDGLASQEEIMEAQDLNIQRREEEINMLNKEIETLTDRNKRLLESSGDSGREMRELTKENARLLAEHEMVTRQLKEHKEHKDNNTGEKTKLQKIIQENNRELKEMEKELYECRKEREHMETEKKKMDEELKTFKTREKNFDEMRKELAKQLERMVPMEKENKALKRELEKLKEEKVHSDEVFNEEETDHPSKRRHFSGHERNRKVSSDKKKQTELIETPVIKKEIESIPETPTNAVSYNLDPTSSNKENPPQRRPSSRRGRKRRSSSHEVHVASLKKQNTDLESTFASDDCNISQHIEIDATPPIAAKAVRKTRKKRSSVDLLRDEKTAEKSNTGTKRATRGKAAKGVSRISSFVSAIKNSPISRTAKKLLDDITESSPIREVKEFPSDYVEVEDMSTQMSAEKPKSRRQTRKKHQLYKEEVQISEPLDCGTFVPSPDDAHQIVQRKLRSRRN